MAHIILADENELLRDLNQFMLSVTGHRIQIAIYSQKAFEDEQRRRTANAAEYAPFAGSAIVENSYCQINLISRLHGKWRFFRKDNSWASVPRIGFTWSDESKTHWPLTVEWRLKNAISDRDKNRTPPAPAAVDHKSKRSKHG